MKFAFFGTPEIAVDVLNELEQAGFVPDLVITNPDAPVGRKHVLTPPPTKIWATNKSLPVFQPASLKDAASLTPLTDQNWDLFVVAAYGKLMPKWLIDLPKHQTLNVHPSLLPQFRGPSPIRSAILADARLTGVTIMLVDEQMDHGPILAQTKVEIPAADWPMEGPKLDTLLAKSGGALLAKTIPLWINGQVTPQEQDHTKATVCKKITKEMAELSLDPHHLPTGDEAYQTLLKIRALAGWPETFFIYNGKRIKIKSAKLDTTGALKILRIVPEGKAEMDFASYFAR